jgi:Protein of unknown function (DUF2721)
MIVPIDPTIVSQGIQLAIAPVFLLTAVAAMIGVVANRLARIIDRARLLEDRVDALGEGGGPKVDQAYVELGELRKRGLLVNASITLLTLCALLIGLTIIVLFLDETLHVQGLKTSLFSFVGSVVSFLLALVCFLAETLMATRLLKFKRPTISSDK